MQASPPSGSYVGVAAGADATRQVVSTDLARLDVSGTSADTDSAWYDDSYLWLPDLGLQRTIPNDGYNPNAAASSATDQSGSAERVGVLTLSRGLGTTVAAGLDGEIHKPLPPMFDADRKVSLRTWLNRALDTMRMPIRLTLTGVANAYRYPLTAYASLLRNEGDLIRVSDREYLSNQDPYVLPGTSRLRFDGGVPYLTIETPIASGYPFYADVFISRKRWIAVTAAATPVVVGGAIQSVMMVRGGTYTTAPTVFPTNSLFGEGAVLTAVLAGNTVASVTVVDGGDGFPVTTTLSFSAGEFALSSVGLVNLDDVCTGPAEDIALLAYYFACRDLATRPDLGTDLMWEKNAQQVAASVAPYLAWGQPEGPQVRASDRYAGWGDHPQFLRRRQSGGSRRWS